jgi:3',5'-cyclic-AMP phosphodiesterase
VLIGQTRSISTATRIVQLTDLHLFADPAQRLNDVPTGELLLDVVIHVRRHAGSVDHLIVTGDHTEDELPESYEAVRRILQPWHDRLWHIPGNHDDRALLQSIFADRIQGEGAQRVTFSFRAGDWLCLGLDTQVPGEAGGLIDAAQVDWIRRELEEHDPRGAVLFLHHPPVLVGCAWLDSIGLEGRQLLHELILEDGRIRLVCCGHVHDESMHQVGGTTVVTTPSTCVQFSLEDDAPTVVAAPPGYRLIDLDGDRCSTRVVRLPATRYSPSAFV